MVPFKSTRNLSVIEPSQSESVYLLLTSWNTNLSVDLPLGCISKFSKKHILLKGTKLRSPQMTQQLEHFLIWTNNRKLASLNVEHTEAQELTQTILSFHFHLFVLFHIFTLVLLAPKVLYKLQF